MDKSVRNGEPFTRIAAFGPSWHLIAYILSIGNFTSELPYLVVLLGKRGLGAIAVLGAGFHGLSYGSRSQAWHFNRSYAQSHAGTAVFSHHI